MCLAETYLRVDKPKHGKRAAGLRAHMSGAWTARLVTDGSISSDGHASAQSGQLCSATITEIVIVQRTRVGGHARRAHCITQTGHADERPAQRSISNSSPPTMFTDNNTHHHTCLSSFHAPQRKLSQARSNTLRQSFSERLCCSAPSLASLHYRPNLDSIRASPTNISVHPPRQLPPFAA